MTYSQAKEADEAAASSLIALAGDLPHLVDHLHTPFLGSIILTLVRTGGMTGSRKLKNRRRIKGPCSAHRNEEARNFTGSDEASTLVSVWRQHKFRERGDVPR